MSRYRSPDRRSRSPDRRDRRDYNRRDRDSDRNGSGNRPPPDISTMVSLKVDNLTYRTRIEHLKPIFSEYGEVGDIYIPRNYRTQESRGFAFVRFYDKRDAEDALDRLDGYRLDGREIRVSKAQHARPAMDQVRGSYNRRSRSRSPGRRRARSYSRSRSRSRSRSHGRDYNRSHSRSPR